ncbi:5507_t:CDS:1, partial [Ambispora gerdemannii]
RQLKNGLEGLLKFNESFQKIIADFRLKNSELATARGKITELEAELKKKASSVVLSPSDCSQECCKKGDYEDTKQQKAALESENKKLSEQNSELEKKLTTEEKTSEHYK